ncbi:hypothetical protein KDA14_05470 [Candidatus Saccharibacteria bacterium]|nr:hypothetical protein [Candidatus Saccharibacteria bacterium]
MKQTVKKPVKKDPEIQGFSYDEFYTNDLALSPALKDHLKSLDLDWRFINRLQFRERGYHRSHWQPFKLENADSMTAITGVDAEGMVVRGDLVLATRPKALGDRHRDFLKQRRARYNGYNKEKARELRDSIREAGLGAHAKVYEGYEDNT